MKVHEYTLLEAPGFQKAFASLPAEVRVVFIKRIERLRTEPYALGKPLGVPWLRELKHLKYRIYYLIYADDAIVLLADTSGKKDQERTIALLRSQLPRFYDFVRGEASETYNNEHRFQRDDDG